MYLHVHHVVSQDAPPPVAVQTAQDRRRHRHGGHRSAVVGQPRRRWRHGRRTGVTKPASWQPCRLRSRSSTAGTQASSGRRACRALGALLGAGGTRLRSGVRSNDNPFSAFTTCVCIAHYHDRSLLVPRQPFLALLARTIANRICDSESVKALDESEQRTRIIWACLYYPRKW